MKSVLVKHEPERLDERQHARIRDVTDEHHGATLSLACCINGSGQQTRAQPLPAPLRMNVQLEDAENATVARIGTGCALPRDIAVDRAICGAYANITSADTGQHPSPPTGLVDETRVPGLGSVALPEQSERSKISSCRGSNHAPGYSTNESTGS